MTEITRQANARNVGEKLENQIYFSPTQSAVLLRQPNRSLTPQPTSKKRVFTSPNEANDKNILGKNNESSRDLPPRAATSFEVTNSLSDGQSQRQQQKPPWATDDHIIEVSEMKKQMMLNGHSLGAKVKNNHNHSTNDSNNSRASISLPPLLVQSMQTSGVSELHAAQLDRGDQDRFNYFYNKHLNQINNSACSVDKNSDQGSRSSHIFREEGETKVPISLEKQTPKSEKVPTSSYQKAPSAFFGEVDAIHRREAREKAETLKHKQEEETSRGKEAFKSNRDESGYYVDGLTTSAAFIVPRPKPHKKLFPHSNLAHVIDKRTDFLRQLTDSELALVAKAPLATGERDRVLSTMLSPFGARGGLVGPSPSTTTQTSTKEGEGEKGGGKKSSINGDPSSSSLLSVKGWVPRQGPRIVSNNFKEQLKDRKHFEQLAFDKSNAFSAVVVGVGPETATTSQQTVTAVLLPLSGGGSLPNAKHFYDTKFHPTQAKNDDHCGDDKDNNADVDDKEKRRQKSLNQRILAEHAAAGKQKALEKQQAMAKLAADLASQRLYFESNSPKRAYEKRRAMGSLADEEMDTATVLRTKKMNIGEMGGKSKGKGKKGSSLSSAAAAASSSSQTTATASGVTMKNAQDYFNLRPPTPEHLRQTKGVVEAFRGHDTSLFEKAVEQHAFHRKREDARLANGTKASVVGGPSWGERLTKEFVDLGKNTSNNATTATTKPKTDYSRYSLGVNDAKESASPSFPGQVGHYSPTRITKWSPQTKPTNEQLSTSQPNASALSSKEKKDHRHQRESSSTDQKLMKATTASSERSAKTKASSSSTKRSISPSTLAAMDARIKALVKEGKEGLAFNKKLMDNVKEWDKWTAETRGDGGNS